MVKNQWGSQKSMAMNMDGQKSMTRTMDGHKSMAKTRAKSQKKAAPVSSSPGLFLVQMWSFS